MFNEIDSALDYVMGKMTVSEGFDHFSAVMKGLGLPSGNTRFIHVAGTNGKGSYIAYLMNAMKNEGYRVGTFQSPHLLTHLDRIRINDANIEAEKFLEYLNRHFELIEQEKLNMFEIDFLIMCEYFSDMDVDVALVEVGLGGRLDATNVISKPLLSVITSIGYDHQEYLGDTLELIAREKAGIIKDGCPALIARMEKGVTDVITEVCREKKADLRIVESTEAETGGFIYRGQRYLIGSMARYQMRNASLVIETARILDEYYDMRISQESISKSVLETVWKGRFHVIGHDPLVVVDGAHNIDGVNALVESFDLLPRPITVVCSILRDKDYQQMLDVLVQNSDTLYITKFKAPRPVAYDNVSIKKAMKIADPGEALERAYNGAGKGSIVICGSLYFISEIYSGNLFDLRNS